MTGEDVASSGNGACKVTVEDRREARGAGGSNGPGPVPAGL